MRTFTRQAIARRWRLRKEKSGPIARPGLPWRVSVGGEILFGAVGVLVVLFLLAGRLLEPALAHRGNEQRTFAREISCRNRGKTVLGHDDDLLDLPAGVGDHVADRANPLAIVVADGHAPGNVEAACGLTRSAACQGQLTGGARKGAGRGYRERTDDATRNAAGLAGRAPPTA